MAELRRDRLVRPTGTVLAVGAAAVAATAAQAATARIRKGAARVRPPASRRYTGHAGQGHKLLLVVAGNSVQLLSFQFVGCSRQLGTTTLDDIPLTWTNSGYRFAITAYGGVSYTDSRLDDNARITLAGQFDPAGRSARGSVRVESPGCGHTGLVHWSAGR